MLKYGIVHRILPLFFAIALVVTSYAEKNPTDSDWVRGVITRKQIVGLTINLKSKHGALTKLQIAMASYLVCVKIIEQTDHLSKLISDLEKLVDSMPKEPSEKEIQDLREEVNVIKKELDSVKNLKDDSVHIRTILKKYPAQFQQLKVDTAWMLKSLNGIRSRMTQLEKIPAKTGSL